MSLGWQGESALLPKRAKAINVDNTSMQRLRAEVYDEQQRRHIRQQDNKTGSSKHQQDIRLRKQRGVSSSSRNQQQSRGNIFSRENRGVRERERRDKDGKATKNQGDKVTLALQAKSRIYDQLQYQQQCEPGQSDGDFSRGAIACQDVLVDFGKKRQEDPGGKRRWVDEFHQDEEDCYSDIEDEFGRARRVLRSSAEYKSSQKSSQGGNAKRQRQESNSRHEGQGQLGPDAGTGVEPKHEGHHHPSLEEHQRQQERAREFLSEVRHDIREAYQQHRHEQQENCADWRGMEERRSHGGVRSQWDEKVMKGEERAHLLAVHAHTEHVRQQQRRHQRHPDTAESTDILPTSQDMHSPTQGHSAQLSSSSSLEAELKHSSSSHSSAKNTSSSVADKRREMLRLKQLEFKQKLEKRV